MHPILFQFGDFTLRTYGLMVATGLLAGIWIASLEARRLGEESERIIDMAFYMVVAAIIGARLLYVVLSWDYYENNPVEVLKIWKGGLVFYGGFIGAVIAGALYVKKNAMPFWRTADIFAIGIPFGHMFGRIGCFAAGCCFGLATDRPWGVEYTHPESMAPLNIHLHPTQIYSALSNLAIFGILFMMRKQKRFEGQLALMYLLLYSIARSVIEFWRGDDRGLLLFGYLSPAQMIGLFLAISSIAGMVWLSRRGQKP